MPVDSRTDRATTRLVLLLQFLSPAKRSTLELPDAPGAYRSEPSRRAPPPLREFEKLALQDRESGLDCRESLPSRSPHGQSLPNPRGGLTRNPLSLANRQWLDRGAAHTFATAAAA